jgi:ferredoxin-NADP reductase
MFTVKQPASRPSGFKDRLAALKPGDSILATQLSGEFTLPGLRVKKLAFLAGGVGIT